MLTHPPNYIKAVLGTKIIVGSLKYNFLTYAIKYSNKQAAENILSAAKTTGSVNDLLENGLIIESFHEPTQIFTALGYLADQDDKGFKKTIKQKIREVCPKSNCADNSSSRGQSISDDLADFWKKHRGKMAMALNLVAIVSFTLGAVFSGSLPAVCTLGTIGIIAAVAAIGIGIKIAYDETRERAEEDGTNMWEAIKSEAKDLLSYMRPSCVKRHKEEKNPTVG